MKKKPDYSCCYIWTRFGDAGDYEQHGDDLSAVATALISNGVKEIFRRCRGGIEANGYEGKGNYISLFWGDRDANFGRELTKEEFSKLLSLSLNESFSRLDKGKGKGRVYERGRSTKGWHKGEKITDISNLKINERYITVSHQFKAENMILITPDPNDSVAPNKDVRYWQFILPDGQTSAHQCTWDFQLKDDSNCEYFVAVKD